MPAAVQLGLVHGAVLSALITVLVLASLRHDPLIWLRSSPRWHVGHYLEGLVGGFVFATLVTGMAG